MSLLTKSSKFSESWIKAFSIFSEYTTEKGGIYELGIRTSIAYLGQIKRFVKFLKIKELSDVVSLDLNIYVTDLKRRKRKKNYISFAVSGVKSAFDVWHDIGLIEDNPFIDYKLPSRKRKGKRKKREDISDKSLTAQALLTVLTTIEESDSIWDLKYKERDWLMIALAYVTGLRVLELSIIFIQKINFTEKYMRVVRKGDEEEIVLITDLLKVPYKNKDVIPDIMEKLIEYIADNDLQPEDRIFNIKENAIWYRIKKWVVQAGLDDKVSTHFLRHTFGSHLGALNVSAPALKTLMNHKRIETTERYITIPPADSGGVLEGMGLYSGKLREDSKLNVEEQDINEKLDQEN